MDLLTQCRRLAAALGFDPCYFVAPIASNLSPGESAYLETCRKRDWGAFTGPNLAGRFKQALQYEYRGVGPVIAFCHPPGFHSLEQILGITVHELGHEAVARAFGTLDGPVGDAHGRDWLRACVHLFHRANVAGFGFSLGDVHCLEDYGHEPKALLPLLSEASDREGDWITSVLKSPYPGTKRKSPKAKATTALAQQSPNGETIRQRMQRHGLPSTLTAWAGGRLLELRSGQAFVDGKRVSLERASRLHARWLKGDPEYCRARPPVAK